MKRIIAITILMITSVSFALGQIGRTTSGPLTVAGVPVYGIGNNGDLFWYFHQGAHNGSATWANGGQRVKLANEWNEGLKVFKGSPAGSEGVIYRVASNGDLNWYKHPGHNTGLANLVGPKRVGYGWQGARIAFAGGHGVVYVIDRSGDLLWYRHEGYVDGNEAWANKANGAKVGVGWEGVRLAFAGGNGVIYAIDRKGDLYWYRHEGYADGTFSWANGAKATKIGNGWNDVASAFSGGNGVIYGLKRSGDLYWYNHTGFSNGATTWASPTGNLIGTGWGEMVRIF